MPLPTWNGQVVDQGSSRMVEATGQAWETLHEALSSARLTDRPAQELLHAVEAAAWLERLAEVGRHLLVPMAKVNGASWANLAAAMGVSRATAQHRHQQQIEPTGKKAFAAPQLRSRGRAWSRSGRWTHLWALVRPIDEFVREANRPAWDYTGPLEPAIQYVCARNPEVSVHRDDDVHYVSSRYVDGGISRSISTSADSEEKAWRSHLGHVLARGKPFPDDARPGESFTPVQSPHGPWEAQSASSLANPRPGCRTGLTTGEWRRPTTSGSIGAVGLRPTLGNSCSSHARTTGIVVIPAARRVLTMSAPANTTIGWPSSRISR